jgi:hypothetical protein
VVEFFEVGEDVFHGVGLDLYCLEGIFMKKYVRDLFVYKFAQEGEGEVIPGRDSPI